MKAIHPKRIAALLVVLAISACAQYELVPAKERWVGDLRVQPEREWNRRAQAVAGGIEATELWTIDGNNLNLLIFALDIADGQPVLAAGGERKGPVFRSDMRLEEIASLFEAAMTKAANSNVFRFRSVEPATVFGLPGLRMEYSYAGADDVDRDGLAVAVVREGKLNLVVFQGTTLLHYGRYLPEVEHIIATARFGQG